MPDIVVLREVTHGMPIEEYADAIRERLPDRDVAVARTPERERELVAEAPVATGVRIDESLLDAGDALELFACLYAGVDHVPVQACHDHGVAVTTASGVHGPNMGEHAVGAIIAFSRQFPRAWRQQERREWRHMQSRELSGDTVTVVGMGAIGQSVIECLSGFDVETIGVRRSPEKGSPADETLGPAQLHDALAETQYLVLACPLTDETRGMIGREELYTLPPEAVLVNLARGPVVDTDALVHALRGQYIRGAQLDVTDPEPLPEDHPLWGLDNVFITPHCSGHTPAYYERNADILAENVRKAAETGSYDDLRNQVHPAKV
ncbi:MAG: D-2-hydroxyacid dehydrogenase [Salinirussus sp.]